MRYLGLDLGSKTLGVSVSDPSGIVASVLKTIYFNADDYDSAIKQLHEVILEYDVKTVILGYPKNMDNSIGMRAEITLEFKKRLESELGLEVILEDERLTSVISNQVLIAADLSRKKRKKKVDGIAAQLILQGYLDRKGE